MVNPTVAERVHNDIWDIFGTLTRDQSVALKSYLTELELSGVLRMPEKGVGEVGTTLSTPTDVPAPGGAGGNTPA